MKIETVPYDQEPVPGRRLDVLWPAEAVAPYSLCFVHGGGWTSGAPEAWHERMREAAGRGVVSASLGYRTGERLGSLMADVTDGYRLFLSLLDGYGLGDLPVMLVGSSAGAHLASLLALSGPWADDGPRRVHGAGRPWREPAACVSLNGPGTLRPWPDMDPGIKAAVEHLAGAPSADFAAASPETHVSPGAPPFLFVVVGKERYFPHPPVYALAERLAEAGVPARVVLLPEAEHGFFYRLDAPGGQPAQAAIDALIASITRTGASSSASSSGATPVCAISRNTRNDGSV